MDYNIRLIKNDSYTPTYWSGGMATELITYPQNSSFAKRDFLWRMGYAKIDIDTSTFSSLPGIKRHLMVTEGHMTLTHKDRYSKLLKPFNQDFFMGDWTTITEGRCSVLNLMTRENYDGTLTHINLSKENQADFKYTYPENSTIIAICIHPLNINIKCKIDEQYFEVNKGDLLYINIINSDILPKVIFINSDTNSAEIITGIIFKNS